MGKSRVLKILDIDTQACGGTHLDSTHQIGPIKIWRVEKIPEPTLRLSVSWR